MIAMNRYKTFRYARLNIAEGLPYICISHGSASILYAGMLADV